MISTAPAQPSQPAAQPSQPVSQPESQAGAQAGAASPPQLGALWQPPWQRFARRRANKPPWQR